MTHVQVRHALTGSDWRAVKALRVAVFVEEQGLPADEEFDAYDESADHAAAVDRAGEVVGTGRLYRDAEGAARIGRMAVRRGLRRRGIGGALLRWLEARAVERGAAEVVVHAQAYLERFYARRGYRAGGPPFIEDGLRHVRMTKPLAAGRTAAPAASSNQPKGATP